MVQNSRVLRHETASLTVATFRGKTLAPSGNDSLFILFTYKSSRIRQFLVLWTVQVAGYFLNFNFILRSFSFYLLLLCFSSYFLLSSVFIPLFLLCVKAILLTFLLYGFSLLLAFLFSPSEFYLLTLISSTFAIISFKLGFLYNV